MFLHATHIKVLPNYSLYIQFNNVVAGEVCLCGNFSEKPLDRDAIHAAFPFVAISV
jgi:hypothetical protein